ncbi:hypothetical protein FXF69_38430 [Actinomadura chibensis]|uniref:Uncharacterized protein n=1 Tax=Actinomadura chibensis TaxID=392828 RepID=A0A5D0N8X7_9ACTN|nr:hypothetical protein FXF69_38430 [Actinomadura chibensis]
MISSGTSAPPPPPRCGGGKPGPPGGSGGPGGGGGGNGPPGGWPGHWGELMSAPCLCPCGGRFADRTRLAGGSSQFHEGW